MYQFKGYAQTHKGNVRAHNEDAYCINDDKQIWCLADGMGGHEAGDIASALAVKAIENIEFPSSIEQAESEVRHAVGRVNNKLISNRNGIEKNLSGTTFIALVAREQDCLCLWAGDSRLYLYRDRNLIQLSKDHSMVQNWVDLGVISIEQARVHPSNNIVTRAIGIEPALELDFVRFTVAEGDYLLLSSDGLHGELPLQSIKDIFDEGGDCETVANRLIDATLAGPANDNITVSVVQVCRKTDETSPGFR